MVSQTPAWLTAATIFAPIIASFGVLWLSNRQQSRNLQAQHDLVVEKDKIAAVISKAEQLYSDIQKWKKHIELYGLQHINYYQHSSTADEFLTKVADNSLEIDFDLVRLKLNLKAYFPELEDDFRKAESLVHESGKLQADMIRTFNAPASSKRDLAGEYVQAQRGAAKALDEFSSALAARIGSLMKLKG